MLKSPPVAVAELRGEAIQAEAPSRLQWGRWVFLAAIPSGLLVAVTAHIWTDGAAAPLLWVLPLSLYLLTWVLVFQQTPLIPHRWVLMVQPLAVAGVVYLLAWSGERNLLITLDRKRTRLNS